MVSVDFGAILDGIYGTVVFLFLMKIVVEVLGYPINALLRLLVSERSQQTDESELQLGPRPVIWLAIVCCIFHKG